MDIKSIREVLLMASFAGASDQIDILDIKEERADETIAKTQLVHLCMPSPAKEDGMYCEAEVIRIYDAFIRLAQLGAGEGAFGGKVLLTWSGLSADEREIWQVPEIVVLTTTLLSCAPWILRLLVDEDHPNLVDGMPDPEFTAQRHETFPGRAMFASLCFPAVVKIWRMDVDPEGNIRPLRNMSMNREFLKMLMYRCPKPPTSKIAN